MTAKEFDKHIEKIVSTLDEIEVMIKKNNDAIKENTAALIEAGLAVRRLEEKK